MKTLGDLTNMIARNAENIDRAVVSIECGRRAEKELPGLMSRQEELIEEMKKAMEVEV